jgi:hypothetical protein
MLTRWPLAPPPGLRHPGCWVAMALGVWLFEVLMPPDLHVLPLGALPVALAAWSGATGWSLTLACLLPWASLMSWWWDGSDMALWIELVNDVGYLLSLWGVALAMTALQRHAVRLALERDPRLSRGREEARCRSDAN